MHDPVDFFEHQFRRQVDSHEFTLNPFEQAALPYLKGCMLDLGCGLGNLALEAGRRGCDVLAVDASPTAVERVNRDASAGGFTCVPCGPTSGNTKSGGVTTLLRPSGS
ncbi:hypothetical protein MASR1M97_09700 [Candidatus Desulfobacillus denitrificans]